MADDAPEHDDLRRQIERLELEAKRLELEIKHEELRNQRRGGRRLAISPVWIPVIGALFALCGSLGTAFVQERDRAQAEDLERLKFERAVLQDAIKEGDPKRAATRLIFASHAGFIHLTDQQEQRLSVVARGDTPLASFLREMTRPKAPRETGTAEAVKRR
jgi:hypothetical protein